MLSQGLHSCDQPEEVVQNYDHVFVIITASMLPIIDFSNFQAVLLRVLSQGLSKAMYVNDFCNFASMFFWIGYWIYACTDLAKHRARVEWGSDSNVSIS